MRLLVRGWVACLVLVGFPVLSQSGPVGGQGAGGSRVSLEKTNWTLTRLGEKPVTVDDPHRRPYLMLDPAAHRASGSGGCNRVTGPYQLTGERVMFAHMASTMMMCPSGMDVERRFLNALNETKRWKIEGQELKLMDGEGKVVAVFEAGSAG
ncbi:MAG: META domain-containing protein [Edaphobacter sp.]